MIRLIRWAGVATSILLIAGCSGTRPHFPEPSFIPSPDPADIESVFFLVGDAGDAAMEWAPILTRMREDVEWWSERLGEDGSVVVLFLGDIVYPVGLHPPGSTEFARDSAVVMGQVELVGGPWALRRGARGYFMAGNHDWGLREDWAGFIRLRTLQEFLDRARARTGADVFLVPEAGTGGPFVVDIGRHIRLLVLDTAWWILDGGKLGLEDRPTVFRGIREAMEDANGRHILIAAHHPFRAAGPHGGEFAFWRTLGIRYLLTRSGAMLQDLTSVPYRELERGLREIFAENDPPLVFIGGHEHSLQIFRSMEPTDPAFSAVSGAASKLTSIGVQSGMQFARSTPGYMRLLIDRNGGATIFVEAAPEQYLLCEGEDEERSACMAEGVSAYEVVHSQYLR